MSINGGATPIAPQMPEQLISAPVDSTPTQATVTVEAGGSTAGLSGEMRRGSRGCDSTGNVAGSEDKRDRERDVDPVPKSEGGVTDMQAVGVYSTAGVAVGGEQIDANRSKGDVANGNLEQRRGAEMGRENAGVVSALVDVCAGDCAEAHLKDHGSGGQGSMSVNGVGRGQGISANGGNANGSSSVNGGNAVGSVGAAETASGASSPNRPWFRRSFDRAMNGAGAASVSTDKGATQGKGEEGGDSIGEGSSGRPLAEWVKKGSIDDSEADSTSSRCDKVQ